MTRKLFNSFSNVSIVRTWYRSRGFDYNAFTLIKHPDRTFQSMIPFTEQNQKKKKKTQIVYSPQEGKQFGFVNSGNVLAD